METYKTIRQTTKVVKPNSSLIFYEIRERPCAYPWVYERLEEAEGPIGICSSGDCIVWHLDGSISVKRFEGETLFFDAVPTIASAVHSKNKGNFYQFHSDGSVTCRVDGKACYYSAPYEAVPVSTNSSLSKFWDNEKNTWLIEGFDLTSQECWKKIEEKRRLKYPELYAGNDDDSYGDGLKCCRGCWKKHLTPEKQEEINLGAKIILCKSAIKRNKRCISSGYEKAKKKLALNQELLQKAEEELAAFEAKKVSTQ